MGDSPANLGFRDLPNDHTADSRTPPLTISFHAAKNETIGFGILVRSENESIQDPVWFVEPLVGPTATLNSSFTTIYRLHAVDLENWPGWHIKHFASTLRSPTRWDPLVPLDSPKGGMPEQISADETYAFWVDIAVPRWASEGTYSSRLVLKSKQTVLASKPIEIRVWPIELPEQGDVVAIGNVDHLAPENPSAFGPQSLSTMRMLRDHRITAVLPLLHPGITVNSRAEIQLDWESYDAVVDPLLSGDAFDNRLPSEIWPLPLEPIPHILETSKVNPRSNSLDSVQQYLSACQAHFREKGWWQRSYAAWPDSKSQTPSQWPQMERFFKETHRVMPDARIVVPWCPQDLTPYGWDSAQPLRLPQIADIWSPPAQFHDPAAMAEERGNGRQSWFNPDRPPYSGSFEVFANPADIRILTWQAAQFQASAIFLGNIGVSQMIPTDTTPSQCLKVNPSSLVFPGDSFGLKEPVASVRLKHLRRAMQDAAYFRLLREHGLEPMLSALTQSLTPFAGSLAYSTHFASGKSPVWPKRVDRFEAAVELMAGEIIRKTRPRAVSADERSFAESLAWRRFMVQPDTMHVEFEGARLHLSGSPLQPEFQLNTSWLIENRDRTPLDVGLELWPPEQWELDGDGKDVAVPISRSRRVVRTMTGPILECDNLGHFELPYSIGNGNRASEHRSARVSLLAAALSRGPIRVDGDLSDWPALGNNVAGDFRLISGSDESVGNELADRPKNATLAFLVRTPESLLIGINCLGQVDPGRTIHHRKGVTYDDGIPVGDDLVEVLLDPHNSGSRLPSDLYHIVVKRDGGDFAEKGIRFEPPVGVRNPWSVDMEVATRIHADRWTTEILIPFSAFEGAQSARTVWGLNVTRFDASEQEFSTWSGAIRNAYDPLSLGNLLLP